MFESNMIVHINSTDLTILLPVYNGEKFLASQLDSLISQTYKNWVCIIRDDGSSDRSVMIINDYIDRYPEKFSLVEDELGNLGVKNSLNILSKCVETPFFGFCDQDDVWHPNKLEISVDIIKASNYRNGVPILVYCDMSVTDEKLNILHNSFFKMLYGGRYSVSLNGLPIINTVAGCSMVGNDSLLNACFPIPVVAPMHDFWVAIVAKLSGCVFHIDKPLMYYRQHDKNQLGAGKIRNLLTRIYARIRQPLGFFKDTRNNRNTRIGMIKELMIRDIKSTNIEACRELIDVDNSGSIKKMRYLYRRGIKLTDSFSYWLP